jgi:hypothetical protein
MWKINQIVQVYVEIILQDIVEINMDNGDFTIDLYLTIYWVDHRLAFNHIDPCRDNLTLDFRIIEMIWNPNVCFVNSYRTRTHASPTPNVLAILWSTGAVMMNRRVRVSGPCEVNLKSFPMDIQTCRLIFESYSYHRGEIIIEWMHTNAINLNRETLADYRIPEFDFVSWNNTSQQEMYTAGYWDQLHITLVFKRTLGFYLLQVRVIHTSLTMYDHNRRSPHRPCAFSCRGLASSSARTPSKRVSYWARPSSVRSCTRLETWPILACLSR